jgi:hypothetical protein
MRILILAILLLWPVAAQAHFHCDEHNNCRHTHSNGSGEHKQ